MKPRLSGHKQQWERVSSLAVGPSRGQATFLIDNPART